MAAAEVPIEGLRARAAPVETGAGRKWDGHGCGQGSDAGPGESLRCWVPNLVLPAAPSALQWRCHKPLRAWLQQNEGFRCKVLGKPKRSPAPWTVEPNFSISYLCLVNFYQPRRPPGLLPLFQYFFWRREYSQAFLSSHPP